MSRIKTKFLENSAVTNAKLADMAQSTIKGRQAGSGTGAPVDLTQTQLTALVNSFVGDSGSGGTSGAVPAPAAGDAAANKFLKADGTWATASGGSGDVTGPASSTDNAIARYDGTTGKIIQNSGATVDDSGNIAATNFSGSSSGTNTGDVTLTTVGATPNANGASLSGQQLRLQPFDSTNPGVVPASGGGTTNFLRADGTWAAASGASVPTIFGSRASPRSIVAATGITSGASHMSTSAVSQDIYVEGSVTGDSVAATITAGTTDGQRMTLIGRNDAQTVTLNSTTTNVALNGPVTLGAGDVINLRWDSTNWHETSRS